jgi:hypothetical protein
MNVLEIIGAVVVCIVVVVAALWATGVVEIGFEREDD